MPVALNFPRSGASSLKWHASAPLVMLPQRMSDLGLLKSARLDQDPPTVVREAQDAISWLSRAVIELDKGSAEAANTLSEALGRLLAVWVFAQTAGDLAKSG